MVIYSSKGISQIIYIGEKLNSTTIKVKIKIIRQFDKYQVRYCNENLNIKKDNVKFINNIDKNIINPLLKDLKIIEKNELESIDLLIKFIEENEKNTKRFDKNLVRKLDYHLVYRIDTYSTTKYIIDVVNYIDNIEYRIIHNEYEYRIFKINNNKSESGGILEIPKELIDNLKLLINNNSLKKKEKINELMLILIPYLSNYSFVFY